MLLNIIAPIIENYLKPKTYIKMNILICALVIIGVFWQSVAIYFYFIMEYDKFYAAAVSGSVMLCCAGLIVALFYYTCNKVEHKVVDTAVKNVSPVIAQVQTLLNQPKIRMAIPVIALLAGYSKFKKK